MAPNASRSNTGGEQHDRGTSPSARAEFLEVFYSGDIEGALARCTDDVDFFSNAPVDILPHMGHRHGQAEMRETWQTIHARYSSMRHEVPIIVAEGDKVAAMIRVFFRKRKNNRIVQFAPRGLLHFSQRAHCADPRGHGHLRSGRTGAGGDVAAVLIGKKLDEL